MSEQARPPSPTSTVRFVKHLNVAVGAAVLREDARAGHQAGPEKYRDSSGPAHEPVNDHGGSAPILRGEHAQELRYALTRQPAVCACKTACSRLHSSIGGGCPALLPPA